MNVALKLLQLILSKHDSTIPFMIYQIINNVVFPNSCNCYNISDIKYLKFDCALQSLQSSLLRDLVQYK